MNDIIHKQEMNLNMLRSKTIIYSFISGCLLRKEYMFVVIFFFFFALGKFKQYKYIVSKLSSQFHF